MIFRVEVDTWLDDGDRSPICVKRDFLIDATNTDDAQRIAVEEAQKNTGFRRCVDVRWRATFPAKLPFEIPH